MGGSGLLDRDALDLVGHLLERVGGVLEPSTISLSFITVIGSGAPLKSSASSLRWTLSAWFSRRLISIQ